WSKPDARCLSDARPAQPTVRPADTDCTREDTMLLSSLYSQASQYHHLPPHSLALPLSNARTNSDTKNRIAAPNSKPRHIKLVGLRNGGAQLVSSLPTGRWRNVEIVTPTDSSAQGLAAGSLPALDDAEMIFVIACSGDD